MNAFIDTNKSHPLATYFILAYAFSWTMVALIPVSFIFTLLAQFGPATAAILVSAVTEGKTGMDPHL